MKVSIEHLKVEILIPHKHSLPWLKLCYEQVRKFRPKVPYLFRVWDNASTDGSREWLLKNKENGDLDCVLSSTPRVPEMALDALIRSSYFPVLCFMDADAIPIAEGWLDEALDLLLSDEKIGAVGFTSTSSRPITHPAFCVVRRDLYMNLKTSVATRPFVNGKMLEVAEVMSYDFEHAGYAIKSLGDCCKMTGQKVVHFHAAAFVLDRAQNSDPSERATWARKHRDNLISVGLWDRFLEFVKETVPLNSNASVYLDVAREAPAPAPIK